MRIDFAGVRVSAMSSRWAKGKAVAQLRGSAAHSRHESPRDESAAFEESVTIGIPKHLTLIHVWRMQADYSDLP